MKKLFFLLLSVVLSVNTWSQEIRYKTIKRNSDQIFTSTNNIWIGKNKSLDMIRISGSYFIGVSKLVYSIDLITLSDRSLVSLARNDNSETGIDVPATFVFVNGKTYKEIIIFKDATKDEVKKSETMAALNLTFGCKIGSPFYNDLMKFDIKSISVKGVALPIKDKGISTSFIIPKILDNNMALSRGERVPNTGSKSFSAADLILHPFGIIDADEPNLTIEQAVSVLRNQYGLDIRYTPGGKTCAMSSQDNNIISWKGHDIEDAYFEIDNGISYGYTIRYSTDYEGRKAIEDFCNDLEKVGIKMESQAIDDNYTIVDKFTRYNGLRIHASFDKWKTVRIRVYK